MGPTVLGNAREERGDTRKGPGNSFARGERERERETVWTALLGLLKLRGQILKTHYLEPRPAEKKLNKTAKRRSTKVPTRGGFLKIISVGVTTYAGMKTGF